MGHEKMELKMTLKEADRLSVVKQIESKKINLRKGSEELGISYRQQIRIWQSYQREGPKGLISKRRGKLSNHRLSNELIQKVIRIIKEKYSDYGPTLVREKLKEKHNLKLAKETLRKVMLKEGIWKAKKVKNKKYHPRRTRRSRFGELEQIDGSYEYWFENRAEKCCLLVCVDDATSNLMQLKFCKTETTQNYIQFLKGYLNQYGRPLSFYSDKHSVFRVNQKEVERGVFTTKFHKVLKKLDIELICAHSPQAKGRVERVNGVLQDRLIKELRERSISSVEEGNQFLEEFKRIYNKKFAIEPANPENAHRKLLPSQNLEQVCMIEEERVLSKDLSFQYKTEIYQIDSEYKHRLYGKRIRIYELNGKIQKILQNGKELKYHKWKEKLYEPIKTIDVKELETFQSINRKPKKYHPWKQGNLLKKIGTVTP
jgi:hypothetical protein